MKRMFAAAALAALGGCAPAGSSSASLAGAWSSAAFAVQTTDSSRAVFATSEITIGSMGEVSGSLRSISPTSVVGEMGTATGGITVTGPATATINATFTFPTLGTFRVSGTSSFSNNSLTISSSSVRDGAGNLVGSISAVFNRS